MGRDALEKLKVAQARMGANFASILERSKVDITKITMKMGSDGCLLVFQGYDDDGEYVAFVGGITPELAIAKAAELETLPWKPSTKKP